MQAFSCSSVASPRRRSRRARRPARRPASRPPPAAGRRGRGGTSQHRGGADHRSQPPARQPVGHHRDRARRRRREHVGSSAAVTPEAALGPRIPPKNTANVDRHGDDRGERHRGADRRPDRDQHGADDRQPGVRDQLVATRAAEVGQYQRGERAERGERSHLEVADHLEGEREQPGHDHHRPQRPATPPALDHTGSQGVDPGRTVKDRFRRDIESDPASATARESRQTPATVRILRCSNRIVCRSDRRRRTRWAVDDGAPGRHGGARERILDSAYELFSTRGIQAVGIDAVITHSGVARHDALPAISAPRTSSCWRSCSAREELWTAGWLQAEVEARADDPAGRLLAIFDVFDEWFRRADFEGCSFINVMLEPGPDDRDPRGRRPTPRRIRGSCRARRGGRRRRPRRLRPPVAHPDEGLDRRRRRGRPRGRPARARGSARSSCVTPLTPVPTRRRLTV